MQEHNKQVTLLDSSGNNPVIANRIERKKGHYYFPFPIVDKDGNEITEKDTECNLKVSKNK